MGNAVYRDLIQASVMVQVKYLALAVPNAYKYKNAGKTTVSQDYDHAKALADAKQAESLGLQMEKDYIKWLEERIALDSPQP